MVKTAGTVLIREVSLIWSVLSREVPLYQCVHAMGSVQSSLQLVELDQMRSKCVGVEQCVHVLSSFPRAASDNPSILPRAFCSADAELLGDGA